MGKQDVVHTHNAMFGIKMKEVLPFMTCVDLDGIMLSEISQKERKIPYDFTYI